MSCNPGMGAFCPEKDTWTPCCGNLQPTNWRPFKEQYPVENYGSCSYNCTAGYGRGCGCGSGSSANCNCGPYNKLGIAPKENYYNTLSSEWTVGANITPANSDLKYDYTHWKKKENYEEDYTCCDPTQYSRLKGTWKSQRMYTL